VFSLRSKTEHIVTKLEPKTANNGLLVCVPPAFAAFGAFRQKSTTNNLEAWALRIPTWGGLGMLLALLMRETRAIE
jgi:hypothetical protein